MVRGSRGSVERWRRFFLWVVPLLLVACSGKKAIREEPQRAASAESLLFLASIQGNPLCMVVDIHQRRSARLFAPPGAKWQMNAWLISPGTSTYLCTKKGKTKKGTTAPLIWTNEKLLFTTDKEEFVFYVPVESGKILLMTDPVFADRVRSGQDEEIRYGRMPAKLFWNNQTVAGDLFYERRAWTERPAHDRKGPLIGLEPGDRVFALWGPDGEFLYVEKTGEIGRQGNARFAVMQDRRGRWQEAAQIEWREPECAFSSSPCTGASEKFRLGIPAWDIEGTLERVTEVLVATEAKEEDNSSPAEGPSSQTAFWASLRAIPQAKERTAVDFCLLRGSIRMEKSLRAVYGIGLLAKQP
jgi:hypothetical protein